MSDIDWFTQRIQNTHARWWWSRKRKRDWHLMCRFFGLVVECDKMSSQIKRRIVIAVKEVYGWDGAGKTYSDCVEHINASRQNCVEAIVSVRREASGRR